MRGIATRIEGFTLRRARRADVGDVLRFIRELAEFEGELDRVSADEKVLADSLFRRKAAAAIFGEQGGRRVGCAIYHSTFSTFLGRPGINLVDLYVEPECRGRGFGREMLAYLASLTLRSGCGRLEWWVHDWNEDAKRFYRRIGADEVEQIRVYRLAGEGLERFGGDYETHPR